MVSVDVKQHNELVQELCQRRGGRPGLLPYLILIVLMGFVDRKATLSLNLKGIGFRAQELCGSRGGRAGLPVPNSVYDLCRRLGTFEEEGTGLYASECPHPQGFRPRHPSSRWKWMSVVAVLGQQ